MEEETIEQWDDGVGHVRERVVRRKRWIEGKIAAQIFILKNRDNKYWQDNPLPEEDMENLKRAKALLDGVESAID